MFDPDDDIVKRANSRIGSSLRGKYRIDRVLGVGGMAVVYAATHRNRAQFAVKMLHPELSLRAELRTRFLREGYVANSVKHPGAVNVVDDDVAEDGTAFLVMEMLLGAPADAVVERHAGILPPAAVLAIGYQLLDVLAAAHANGLVHRDIKPANLFITHDGSVKVLDFGIARLRDTASSMATGTGAMLGTPAFMAPEQAQGKTSAIDAQTDVWAVGATLFSMLSGHYVHEGDNPQALIFQAGTETARPVASLVRGLPLDIAQIIDRALAFRKEDRFPSASAMQVAVRAAYVAHFSSQSDKLVLSALVGPNPTQPSSAATMVSSPSGAITDPTSVVPAAHAVSSQAVTPVPSHSPVVTTARPIARDSAASSSVPAAKKPARSIRTIVTTTSIAVAGVVAALAGAVGRSSPAPGSVGSQQTESAAVTAIVLPQTVPTVRASVAPLPEPVPVEDLARGEPGLPATPIPVVVPAPPGRPTPGPTPLTAIPIVSAVPARPPPPAPTRVVTPSPAPKVDCSSKSYVDKEGNKHFKPECFGK